MTANLHDWRDGLLWRLVEAAFSCDREQGTLIGLCRQYERDYMHLRADGLIEAREDEIKSAAA